MRPVAECDAFYSHPQCRADFNKFQHASADTSNGSSAQLCHNAVEVWRNGESVGSKRASVVCGKQFRSRQQTCTKKNTMASALYGLDNPGPECDPEKIKKTLRLVPR